MAKMMQREITKTTVNVAKMVMVDGEVQVEQLPSETFVGNLTMEQAQWRMKRKYKGEPVQVVSVEPNTEVYELPVEKFLEVATVRVEKEEDQEEQTEAPEEQVAE